MVRKSNNTCFWRINDLIIIKHFLDALGTIDYISDTNGYVPFRTSPVEKDRLIFQMGTSSPERAVKLAKMVIH